jgi:hypothetical protein
MATSLLEGLSGLVTPQLLADASRTLGEPEAAVSSGLRSSGATILAGLAGRAANPQSMGSLFDLISSPGATGGPSLLSSLFGSRTSSVGDAIGRTAGLRPGAGGALLDMAAPLVLGLLGSRVRTGGLDPAGLGSLLLGERDGIMRALPAGLSSFIAGPDADRAAAGPAVADASARAGPNWLWPAVAALALIALVWVLRSMNRSPGEQTVGALTPALPAVYGCGDRSVSVDQVDDRAVLTTGTETFTLRPVQSASGAKYEAEGDPATTFWSKGDRATVTIRGQSLPECTRR